MAHKWAAWLHNPYHLGGSPTLESGGHNHKWRTGGRGGYTTFAVCGGGGGKLFREGGSESEVAHKWTGWLHNPCHLGGGGALQSVGQNQKTPTSGPWCYTTPGVT